MDQKAKTNVYIAILTLLILTFLNIVGGVINDYNNFAYGLNEVIELTPLHIIFAFFYWLSCLPKIKIRNSLRLPLLRTLFWISLTFNHWAKGEPIDLATGDFIDAFIPSFCFFIQPIAKAIQEISWLNGTSFYLYGLLIIGVGIYQVLVLEIARMIVFTLKKK